MPPGAFCESDKDCRETDQLCDTDRNTCVDCFDATECDGEAICSNGSCVEVTPCESSKDCGEDEVCSTDLGYCVQCLGDNDCADEKKCVNAVCLDSCDSDKDCRDLDGVCDSENGVCVECATDTDCSEDEYCWEGGQCQERVCREEDAFCRDGEVTQCNARGTGFETMNCSRGCDEEGQSCETMGNCEDGTEGCPCYANDTCNDALSCLSGLCVDADGTGGNTGSGGTNGTGGGSSGTGNYCHDIPRFVGTQTVDGSPDEFMAYPAMQFDFSTSGYQQVEELSANNDTTTTSATVRMAWDSTALRLHVHVDDALVAHTGGLSYDGDNVQLFVSSTPPSGGTIFGDGGSQITISPDVLLPSAESESYEQSAGVTGT